MENVEGWLQELTNPAHQDDEAKLLAALKGVRGVLSETSEPVEKCDTVVKLNGILILRSYLTHSNPDFVFEAAWALTNIASSSDANHCKAIVEADVHKNFIALLEHPNVNVLEQAVWGLGNIAGDCVSFRDMLLTEGVAPVLCSIFTRDGISDSLKENAAWVLSNLCRGKPSPSLAHTLPIITLLSDVLKRVDGATIGKDSTRKWLGDMLWALSYLTESEESIDTCIQHGLIEALLSIFRSEVKPPGLEDSEVVPRRIACEQLGDVLEFLPYDHLARLCTVARDVTETTICDNSVLFNRLRARFSISIDELRTPTVRIIGNVVAGRTAQTKAALACGALELIEAISQMPGLSESLKKEITWTLSNIVAEFEFVDSFTSKPALVQFVSDAFNERSRKIKQEASYVVGNILQSVSLRSTLFVKRPQLLEQLVLPAMVCASQNAECRTILEEPLSYFQFAGFAAPEDDHSLVRLREVGEDRAEYLQAVFAELRSVKRETPLTAEQVTCLLWRAVGIAK